MITITDRAIEKLQAQLINRGHGIGIRVGVRTSGCSGMAYTLEFADEARLEDKMFKYNDVAILVDFKNYPYLTGTEIDYVKKGLNEGFEFVNPNERARCGCGESFTV
jgi:iron-sulfur cluster assembly protein